MKTENEVVSRWFRDVGVGANDVLFLFVEPGRAYISDVAGGEVATLMTDCDQLCEAATLAELAEILQRDLDALLRHLGIDGDLDESYSVSDD